MSIPRQLPLRCGPQVAATLCRALRYYTEARFPPRRAPGCDLVARDALQSARHSLERQLRADPRRLSINRRTRPLYREAVRSYCAVLADVEGRDTGPERAVLLAALAGDPVPDASLQEARGRAPERPPE